MKILKPILFAVVICQLFFTQIGYGSVAGEREEEFYEELLFRPLPDRKVMAHFRFESTTPPSTSLGQHHHLFPKAIAQLVQKFQVKEMELSFTQGRWNYKQWGGFDPIPNNNAKPPGIELWAVFDVPQDQVDNSWKNLTHTLSGLFCASINFMESSTTYSAPEWSFRSTPGNLRYGALPREAVCTENLTPWLKLLPCRDKAGLSTILHRPSIYRSFYHSQRLRLSSIDSGVQLEQTLTVVLQPSNQKTTTQGQNLQPSWSMSSIFGRKVSGRCMLAKSSNVYLQLERGLVAQLKNQNNEDGKSGNENLNIGESWSNLNFQLSVKPDRIFHEADIFITKNPSILFEFSVDRYSESQPFDLGLTWKVPAIWKCQHAPLVANRFLMGSGNERGAIAISLKATESINSSTGSNSMDRSCKLKVNLFQSVPWYIKVYYHTLEIFVDGQLKPVKDVVEKMRVSPSQDKVSPGLMEMALSISCGFKAAAITLEFDKGFLHIDEYPPDANQGFDIPSAVITFPDFHSDLIFHRADSLIKSPVISMFQEKSHVVLYTEILLVPLTNPDFSMPYNVITITCTVCALYFGSLLNALRKRVGEEERLLESKASEQTSGVSRLLLKISAKLRGRPVEQPQSPETTTSSLINPKLVFKVVLVAAFAVYWQYFSG